MSEMKVHVGDTDITFRWEGVTYVVPVSMGFPVVIEPGSPPRAATGADHRRRARMAWRGDWRRRYQIGRDSKLKPWFFEWTHALKNIIIEEARELGNFNRGNRDPLKPDGYVFPRKGNR